MAKKDFNIEKQDFNNKSYEEKFLQEETKKDLGYISKDDMQFIKEALEVIKNQPHRKLGRPKKTEEEKLGNYKFTLNLDGKVKRYLQNIAWQNRLSLTQYVRNLILDDMERYYQECKEKGVDPEEGWEEV